MLLTGSDHMDAERAFTRALRARRRAAIARWLRRSAAACARLRVYDGRGTVDVARGVQPIPLDAITGTLEPSRAGQFDSGFRPAKVARTRWMRVWMAEQRGAALPPVSVVRVGDEYALRDGHHRVSVAKARGAVTIDAVQAA